MDNQIFNAILPYLSLGMLTLFAVFVVLGMLFGLGRGAKRSGIRLVTFAIFLLIAFFITPFVVNGVLSVNVKIAGQTPQEYVNDLSERLVEYLKQQFGDYVAPFQDYIKEYALGIVIAGLNLVIFFALFYVVKIVSWFFYAIIAHFAAPKRDHNGKRLPKHAGFGLLIGALQGVFLFFFFMFPLNGIVGVVNNAAEYETMQAQNEHQQVETQSVGGGHHSGSTSSGNVDINALVQKLGEPLKMYNNFMRYTGLQYLSDKAFEYQLTIRVKDADDINLVHDINSGFELYIDSQNFLDVVKKLQNAYSDGKIDLTGLTAKDYQILRNFINKAFDLQILNVANDLLGSIDDIFSQPFNNNQTKLAGTEIYENSIYGLLIKQNTTNRGFTYVLEPGETAPTNYAQFAKGLRALINYVGEQKLNLVRNDVINMIDFVENLNNYKIVYNGATKKLSEVLAQENLGVKEYFDLCVAKLAEKSGNHQVGEYLINALGNHLMNFSAVKMLGLTNFDNLLLYSKAMDTNFGGDDDLKTLVDGLIPLFLGENALTHDDNLGNKIQGNWEKLGSVMLNVAQVLRNYVTIVDDINVKKQKFVEQDTTTTDENEKASKAQMKAILEYLSELVDPSQTNKYQKIDDLVDALYQIIDDFEPVKVFVKAKLQDMQTSAQGDYVTKIIATFDEGEEAKEKLKSTLKDIVNVANIVNNSGLGDLIEDAQNMTPTEIANKLVDSVAELDKDEVESMVKSVLEVPQIGDAIQDSLSGILAEINDTNKVSDEQLVEYLVGEEGTMTPEQIAEVRDQITAVQNILTDLSSSSGDKETLESQLPTAVGSLWEIMQKYSGVINIPEGL